jgi:hypothetical protein
MTAPPPEVVEFVSQFIRSPEDLAVFLVCVTEHDRWWDASTMAREVAIGPVAAQSSLDQLARSNLLDIRLTADIRYQFHPGTRELRDTALATAAAYRSNPIGVVRLVANPRQRSVRDFADAFKLRKP